MQGYSLQELAEIGMKEISEFHGQRSGAPRTDWLVIECAHGHDLQCRIGHETLIRLIQCLRRVSAFLCLDFVLPS